MSQSHNVRPSILIVDDDPAILNLTATMLDRSGFAVTKTSQPEEAMKILRDPHRDFDLLITDFGMRGMTGGELVSAASRERSEMKILGVSGYPGLGAVFGREGPILAKPFTLAALVTAVRSILDAPSIPGRIGAAESTSDLTSISQSLGR